MRYLPSFLVCTVLLAGAFLASPAFAAGSWYTPTSGITTSLYGVDMYGETALAVGAAGKILRSKDYGGTWTAVTSGSTSTLNGVDTESGYAIVVGNSGTILRSVNGGASWTASTSGTTATLYDVALTSNGYAIAVGTGGKILRSTNYGLTWSTVASGTTATLYDVEMWGTSSAYIAGSTGTILKGTGTAGETWAAVTSGTTANLYGIAIATEAEIWAVGSGGVIRHSFDGAGAVWNGSGATGLSSSDHIWSISMSSLLHGRLVASNDGEYDTTNGGTFTPAGSGSWSGATFYKIIDADTLALAVGTSGAIRRYDAIAPTVGTISPTTALEGVPATFSVTATDEADVARCDLYITAADGSGVLLDGVAGPEDTWSAAYTLSAGAYTTGALCYDAAGNSTAGAEGTLTVEGINTAPTVGTLGTTINGTAVTFSVETDDADGAVVGCTVVGTNGTADIAEEMMYDDEERVWDIGVGLDSGTWEAYVTCVDDDDAATVSDTITFTIEGAAAADEPDTEDTTDPVVGTPSPTTFTLGTSRTVTATVSDNGTIDSCDLYVNAENAGMMTVSGGTARKSYTFSTNDWQDGDTAIVTVECADVAGNVDSTSVTVTLSAAATVVVDEEQEVDVVVEPEATTNTDGEANAGSLMKLACDDTVAVDVNDPCKAVYFYSSIDGKRHAFPNEKVFFTWYADFDDVVVVSADFMASVTLGRNVTYRPGTRMVKFVTVNTVYAVGTDGALRAIDSEATATALYGSAWNTHIDDISDAFYGNYTFGDDVDDERDFDVGEVEDSVDSIDDIL